ncbi:Uncharacterised protein [Mycobacteroides abscessus]|nr:Uncharacterised protein [Mycobacteroides abscessus]
MNRTPTCSRRTAANVHRATWPADRRPMPWRPNRRCQRKPARHSGTTRMSAWAATPSVAVPARSAILVPSHCVRSSTFPVAAGPYSAMNAANPAIDTTLLSTGAHMNGPNCPRALRTCPSSVYRP